LKISAVSIKSNQLPILTQIGSHWPEKQIRKSLIEFIIKVRRKNHIPAAVHHSTGIFEPKIAADFSSTSALLTSHPSIASKPRALKPDSSSASYLHKPSLSKFQTVAVGKNVALSSYEPPARSCLFFPTTPKTNSKTFNDKLREMGLTSDRLKSEIAEGMAIEKLPKPSKHKHVFLAEHVPLSDLNEQLLIKYISRLTGPTISELYMGEHATPFTLHTRLLCENSGFFARLLCQATTTQDRCFISVDPKVFAAVFDWLYRGKLPDITVNNPEAVHSDLLFRMNIYKLAHQLDMPNLKDDVMTDIVRGSIMNSILPNSKEIEFAYDMTTQNSTLRQYIARMFQFMLHMPDTSAMVTRRHASFSHDELEAFLITHTELGNDVSELNKAFRDIDEREVKEILDPRLVFICNFHEHLPGYDGCRWVGYTAGFFHGEGLKLRQEMNW
jgi:hypothetical protein